MDATPMLPSNFQINATTTTTKLNELRITNLYLHHAHREPSPTHLTVVSPNGPGHFGSTVANNWAIYDGPDPSEDTIVARAQGLHIHSGNWHNSFTIVFEIEGLKGSALQVMGLGVQKGDQWSIVGGTGQFTLAQGYINKKLYSTKAGENIIQLDIYAIFHTPMKLTREGPVGGKLGDDPREPKYEPYRLDSIKIRHGSVIDSIEYTYFDINGIKRTEGPWGGSGGPNAAIIELGPGEFVKEVSGTFGPFQSYEVVTSLNIITNLRTFGPYGEITGGSPFSFPETKGGSIVGFFGRTGGLVDALGVIVRL